MAYARLPKFYKKDEPHGKIKRIIYQKYVESFLKLHKSQDIVIIDGFSGCGHYGESYEFGKDINEYGSPIIALQTVLGKFPKRKVFFYFNDKNSSCYEVLNQNVRTLLNKYVPNDKITTNTISKGVTIQVHDEQYPIVCTITNKDFVELQTPKEITQKKTKTLIFLDPFGIHDTPMESIVKYVGKNTSLILNFMSFKVRLEIGKEDKSQVLKIFGGDIWSTFDKETNIERKIEETVNIYARRINGVEDEENISVEQYITDIYEQYLRINYKKYYPLSFEMRGERDRILYHLLFLTPRRDDFERMKEIMNRCTQSEFAFSVSDCLFDSTNGFNLKNIQNARALGYIVSKQFEGQEKVPLISIRKFIVYNTRNYVFRKKPLKYAEISEVVDEYGSSPKCRGTLPNGKRAWYISFKTFDDTMADYIFRGFHGQSNIKLSQIKNHVKLCMPYNEFRIGVLVKMALKRPPLISYAEAEQTRYTFPVETTVTSAEILETHFLNENCLITFRNFHKYDQESDKLFQKYNGQTVTVSQLKPYFKLEHIQYWKKVLKLMETEEYNPRITSVSSECCRGTLNHRRRGTFPDKTDWRITFRCKI